LTEQGSRLRAVSAFIIEAAGLFAGWVAMEYGIARLLAGLVTWLSR
jgi:hypothetical protein